MSLSNKSLVGGPLNWLTIEPHAVSSAKLADWFEDETGIETRIRTVPYSAITDVAMDDVTAGVGQFDLVQYWYPMLGALVQHDVLADISTWWDQNADFIKPEDFIPVFGDTWCLVNGRRFGVPFDGDMHLLFYNKTILERHGLQPPNTWDRYLQVARTITEAEGEQGVYGCGIMAADIPLILIGTFLNRLAGFGGDFFDADGQPTINSPVAVAALEHLIAELPYALPEPTEVAFDEMLGPWLAGRVAMVEFWADLGKISEDPTGSRVRGQWGVVPLPQGPEPHGRTAAPLNAGWSLGVSAISPRRELALEFLQFSLRSDVGLRISTITGGLDPCRWSIYELPAFRSSVSEELAAAAGSAVTSAAVPWPTSASWPDLQGHLHQNLYLALTGVLSAKEVLDDTQAVWRQMLAL